MKQTAVEWLAETLRFANKELYAEIYEHIEQAKEMEKEQMIDFTMDYVNSDSIGCLWDGDSAPELDIDTSAEQYYYRTFKTNEK
jgi:predicted solute-binding protein